ncbi:MAG: hypothetical protein K2H14_03195, partial [Muribaculaceae bacterium]|nr:hypothetical protein [Muribaculaceae bacterium]
MKLTGKITLLALGAAIAGSAVTTFAINAITERNQFASSSDAETTAPVTGRLYTVAGGATTPPTDFTHAAESTINGVVSIKSYATPRG